MLTDLTYNINDNRNMEGRGDWNKLKNSLEIA